MNSSPDVALGDDDLPPVQGRTPILSNIVPASLPFSMTDAFGGMVPDDLDVLGLGVLSSTRRRKTGVAYAPSPSRPFAAERKRPSGSSPSLCCRRR